MTQGLLGKATLAASTYTSVAQAAGIQTINIRVVNRDKANGTTLRLAICPAGWVAGAAPAPEDYIETMDMDIPGGGVLEEIGVAISNGERVVAFSPSSSMTVRVFGF